MTHKPPLSFPVQQNATTVGPSYAQTITMSRRLIQITEWVVLTRDNGVEHAELFRNSTDAPELRSCDVYERPDGGPWQLVPEAKRKYEPGAPPKEAHRTIIDGMDFHTLHVMTAQEIEEHRTNLRRLLIRP